MNKAVVSGALGATASFIGKLAFASDSPVQSWVFNQCSSHAEYINSWICPKLALVSRGICLLLMIGTNAIMISSFVEGMGDSGSVVGTALSTASNFTLSVCMFSRLAYESGNKLTLINRLSSG